MSNTPCEHRRVGIALLGALVLLGGATPAAAAVVRARFDLVMRAKPDNNAKVVDHVRAGTQLDVLRRQGEWALVRVHHRHHQAWAAATLLGLDKPALPATATTMQPTLRFAQGPSTTATTTNAPAAAGPVPAWAAPAAATSAPLAPAKNVRPDSWVARTPRTRRNATPAGAEALTQGSETFVGSEATAESLIMKRAAAHRVATKEAELDPAYLITRRHSVVASASTGVAILRQRLVSNGTGPLANYDYSTSALSVAASLGYRGALGPILRLGVDGTYAFAGGAQIEVPRADGTSAHLPVSSHAFDLLFSIGAHTRRGAGIDINLVIGGEVTINAINGDLGTNLPSDRVYGLVAGLAMDAPHLLLIGTRPLGVRAFGLALAPGSRGQNLPEGRDTGTYGVRTGGGLELGLTAGARGQLTLVADYSFSLVRTHFVGASRFDSTSTLADLGSLTHNVRAGLEYRY